MSIVCDAVPMERQTRAIYPVRNSHAPFPSHKRQLFESGGKSVFALFSTGRTTSGTTSTLLADLSHAEGEMPRVSFDFPCHVRRVIKEGKSEPSCERVRE